MGVGDGDLGAALAVADRSWIGAGRLRPDLERPLGREPGDRAAARADGDHVDHRDLGGVDAHAALGGERGLAVDDDRDVGRGAAAVAGEHPVEAGDPGDQRGAERAGGRAGQHGGDRLVHDLVGAQHAAVRLHDVERHLAPAVLLEPATDVGDVAAQPRLHRGVDEGGHGALVLAVLPQHLAGDGDDGPGVLLGEDRPHPLLVLRVGVGVQEADAEGVDARGAEPARHLAGTGLVERPHLCAGEVQAPTHRPDQVPGHDPGRLHPEVGVAVAVGHRLPCDLQHRVVPLGGDEPERVDLALQQLVGRHRGAVADRRDRAAVAGRETEQPQHLVDARHEPVGRVRRRRRGLGRGQLPGLLVEGDDVGEGATGVDADADPASRGLRHADHSNGPVRRPARATVADEPRIHCQVVPATTVAPVPLRR